MSKSRDRSPSGHGKPLPRQVQKPLVYLVRAGYVARGTVYVLTGLLAGASAAGVHGETDDTQGAMQLVRHTPFGSALLVALSAGLVLYALWFFARAIFDPEGQATGRWGWVRRIFQFFTGLVYGGLVYLSLQTLMGRVRNGEGDRSARHWTVILMEFPLGRWAVAAVGAGFVGYMIGQIAMSFRPRGEDQLDMRRKHKRWVHWMILFGTVSRALIFGVIGLFFIVAAIHFDPRKVQGIDGALRALRGEPAGRWLLGFVALGLIAYGAYDLVLAAFRVIRIGAPSARSRRA
jgi:hypothetical protein